MSFFNKSPRYEHPPDSNPTPTPTETPFAKRAAAMAAAPTEPPPTPRPTSRPSSDDSDEVRSLYEELERLSTNNEKFDAVHDRIRRLRRKIGPVAVSTLDTGRFQAIKMPLGGTPLVTPNGTKR